MSTSTNSAVCLCAIKMNSCAPTSHNFVMVNCNCTNVCMADAK